MIAFLARPLCLPGVLARCLVLSCSLENGVLLVGPLKVRGLCGPPRGSCFSLIAAPRSCLLSSRKGSQPDGWAVVGKHMTALEVLLQPSTGEQGEDVGIARSLFTLHRPVMSTYGISGTGLQLIVCWTLFQLFCMYEFHFQKTVRRGLLLPPRYRWGY